MINYKIGEVIAKVKNDKIVFFGLAPGCQYTYIIGATSMGEEIQNLLTYQDVELVHIALEDKLIVYIGKNFIPDLLDIHKKNPSVVYYGMCGEYTITEIAPKSLNEIVQSLKHGL